LIGKSKSEKIPEGVTRMYKKKNVTKLVILWVFIAQILFTNVFSLSVLATESVSYPVFETVPTTTSAIESKLIGDVNDDGEIDSIDFALMRMVLLGLKSSFPVVNGEWASDVDGNGLFNSIDFAYMRKFLLGYISVFPAVSKPTPTTTPTVVSEVSISLENQPTRKGDIITASINIGEISNLAGYGLNIKYNSDVLKPVDSTTKNPYEEDTIPKIGDVLADTNYEYVTMARHDLNEGILSFGRTVKDLDEYRNKGNAVVKGVLAEISFEVLEVADVKIEVADDIDNKYWRAGAYINKKGVQFFDLNGDSIDVKSTASVNNVDSSTVDNNDLNSGSTEIKDLQEHTVEGYIGTLEAQDFNIEIFNDEKNIIGSSNTDEKGYFQIKYTPDSYELVTLKISKEGYLSRFVNIPVGMKGVQLGTKDSPLDMWIGETNGDCIIDINDIMYMVRNSDEEKIQKTLSNYNRVPDDYCLEIILTCDSDSINGDINILKNTVFDVNKKKLFASNLENAGSIYLRGGEIHLSGDYEQGINVLSIQASLIDMQNGKMEVNGNVKMDAGTMYINGGDLHVKGEYHLKNNAVLKMTQNNDYVIIEGNTFIYTKTNYDNCLTAGILELKGDFTINSTPNNNVFEAYGTHKTVLSGKKGQTINMENGHRPHTFNTLILLESEEHYNFIPPNKEFWKEMLDHIPVMPTEPEAPNLTGVWHNNTARLYWSKTDYADRYNVYRSSMDGGPYYNIAENHLRKDFIDVDVKEGNKYYYVVEAVNRYGVSNYSNQIMLNSEVVYDIETIDMDADYSGDGLTNGEALEHGTNIFKWDTDEDGISDYDEIYVYGTDPLSPDTSGDGIYDGAALMLGLEPLESHEGVETCKTALSSDGRVEVTAWGDGNVIMSPLQVWDSDNMILANLEGIVGKPVEITNGGFPIKYAEIRISYNREDLGDISEDELTIFHANAETQMLEEIDDVRVDKDNQVVIGTTTHFSPFFIGSMQLNKVLASEIVFALDRSGSMANNDKNNISVASTIRFVEQSIGYNLAGTQKIGLVGFDYDGYELYKIEDSSKKGELLGILKGMGKPSGGSTNITDGIRDAADLFTANSLGQKIIVLLTDGEATRENNMVYINGEKVRQELALARELAKKGVKIHTIALGNKTERDLLKAIADETGGVFYFVDNQTGFTQDDVNMQISNIFTKLSNTLTIPNGKNHNATPDPWNLRFAHEDFWSSKVEIRHELSTSLKDQAGDKIIVDVKNDYDMKEFDPTIADENDYKLEVNELETLGSINQFFLDLKELKRGFFRYDWLDLKNYNLDDSMKNLFAITSDSNRLNFRTLKMCCEP